MPLGRAQHPDRWHPRLRSLPAMSFSTLLVANRGEIARRIFRSAREMGLRCVAIYVDADADAPFVAEADEAVRLETSYLDADAVLFTDDRI